MKEWKQFFPPRILMKGKEYYMDSAVEDVKETNYGYHSYVSGSDLYDVKIHMKNNAVSWMECTCPWAEENDYCKHMAAVLCAIDDSFIEEGNPVSAEDKSLSDIMDSLSASEIQSELIRILLKEDKYRNAFITRYRTTPPREPDINRIVAELDDLSQEYGDYSGYIYWQNQDDYSDAFIRCLQESVAPLLSKHFNRPAFDILLKALEIIADIDMDGSFDDITSEIYDLLETAVTQAEDKDRQYMSDIFDRMYQSRDGSSIDYFIESVYFNIFNHDDVLLQELNDCRHRLQHSIYEQYELNGLLYDYTDLLQRLNLPLDEYVQWLQEHSSEPVARDRLLDIAEDRGDLDTVEKLLNEALQSEISPYERTSLLRHLQKTYQKQNNNEKEKECLRELIIRNSRYDLEDIFRLEELCDEEEWNLQRSVLISLCPNTEFAICRHDRLYDRLIALLPHQPLSKIDEVREEIKDLYPEELTAIYTDNLNELVTHHPGRYLYKTLKNYLLILAGIRGGTAVISELTTAWAQKYPTRTAMLTMLEEVRREIQ